MTKLLLLLQHGKLKLATVVADEQFIAALTPAGKEALLQAAPICKRCSVIGTEENFMNRECSPGSGCHRGDTYDEIFKDKDGDRKALLRAAALEALGGDAVALLPLFIEVFGRERMEALGRLVAMPGEPPPADANAMDDYPDDEQTLSQEAA